jgi:hypothetical protein
LAKKYKNLNMKNFIIIGLLIFYQNCFCQKIGINTENPASTLDINGSLAIRATKLDVKHAFNTKVDLLTDRKSAYVVLNSVDQPLIFYGLVGGSDGRIVVLWNSGSYSLTLVNDANEANYDYRIKTTNNENIVIAPNGYVTLIYDILFEKWRVIAYDGYQTNQWNTNGNNGFNSGYLGTTNMQDVVFKTNNVEAMRVTALGKTIIGTNPDLTNVLEVNQNVAVKNAELILTTNANLPMDWSNKLFVSNNGINARQIGPGINWPNNLYFNTGVKIGETDQSFTNDLEVTGTAHFADNVQAKDNITVNTSAKINEKIVIGNASILDNTPVAENPNLMTNFLPIAWAKIELIGNSVVSKTSNNVNFDGGLNNVLSLVVPGYTVVTAIVGCENNWNYPNYNWQVPRVINLIRDIYPQYGTSDQINIVPYVFKIDPNTLNHQAFLGSGFGPVRKYRIVIFGYKN